MTGNAQPGATSSQSWRFPLTQGVAQWSGTIQGSASRRASPWRLTLGATPKEKGGCACALTRLAFAPLSSRQPSVSRQQVVHVLMLSSGSDVIRKRSWTADASCHLAADCNSMDIHEQEIGFHWALIPNSDGPGEDVTPFLPRFLLQEGCLRSVSERGSSSQPAAQG